MAISTTSRSCSDGLATSLHGHIPGDLPHPPLVGGEFCAQVGGASIELRNELNIIPQWAVYRFTRRRTMASANAPDVLHSPVRPQRRPLRSGSSPPTARDPSP